MKYLALGDSISIDRYTGAAGGGAASQFAVRVGAVGEDFQDLGQDGNTTWGVLEDLKRVTLRPEIVTLTVGGNDLLLMGGEPDEIAGRIAQIAEALDRFGCPVILNTVYDPTDGDDRLAAETGIPRELREPFNRLNRRIREIAAEHGFLLADLERLFHGHGLRSPDPWFVQVIEPNLAGATATARHWQELLRTMEVT